MIAALDRFTRAVNRVFLVAAGVLTLVVVAVVLQDVIRRYVFDDPSLWALDVARFTLFFIVFLGLAPALELGKHVNVDVVVLKVPAAVRRVLLRVAQVAIVAFGLVLLRELAVMTLDAAVTGEVTTTYIPVPIVWIYTLAPIGVAQFVLTGLAMMLRPVEGG